MALKFDDCVSCIYRKSKKHCGDCDFGEFYESEDSYQQLSFDDITSFDRADKSLVTEEDEPYFNPDDYVRRLDEIDDDNEEINDLDEDL